MKKTFKQLLKQYPTFTNDKCYGETCVLEMLKLVREKTIEECIQKGYGLYYENIFDKNPDYIKIEETSLKDMNKNLIEL